MDLIHSHKMFGDISEKFGEGIGYLFSCQAPNS
ncbi:hypothetical protein V2J09_001050 [Rumex salicifolius]